MRFICDAGLSLLVSAASASGTESQQLQHPMTTQLSQQQSPSRQGRTSPSKSADTAHRCEEVLLAADAKLRLLEQEKENTAQLLLKLGEDQVALAEQLRALEVVKDSLESERGQLLPRVRDLESQSAKLVEERDLLLRRVTELASHVHELEAGKAALVGNQALQLSMAAAAGAAGAAAAVAVSALPPAAQDAQCLPQSPTSSPGADQPPSNTGPAEAAKMALFALGKRTADLQAELSEVVAEREAALSRNAHLEEEVQLMGGLLRQAVDARAATFQQVECTSSLPPSGVVLPGSASPPGPAGPATLSSPLQAARSAYSFNRRPPASRASDSQVFAEQSRLEPADSSAGPLLAETSHTITPSSILIQSSQQSLASEAPLAPTRRFTDMSEFHLLDPTEPLEELLQPASMLTMGPAAGSSGRALGGMPQAPPRPFNAAQMEAELEGRLATALQEYRAELGRRQDAHEAEVVELYSRLAAATAASRPEREDRPASSTYLGLRVERSMPLSESGLLDSTSYETELLQHIAGLEVQVVDLKEQSQRLIAQHEEHERKLAAELRALQSQHDTDAARLRAEHQDQLSRLGRELQELAEAQAAKEQASHDEISALQRQVVNLREDGAHNLSRAVQMRGELVQQQTDHREEAAELGASYRIQLVELQAKHDMEASQLRAAHQDEVVQLRLTLQGLEDDQAVQQRAARQEITALQQRVAGLVDQVAAVNTRSADALGDVLQQDRFSDLEALHRSQLAELRAQHEEEVEGLLAEHDRQLSQLRCTLQALESAREAQQEASRDEVSVLQRQVALLKEQAALHQSQIRLVREEMARQQEARHTSAADLEARLTDLQVHHGSELASLQSLYELQLTQLRLAIAQHEGAQSQEHQASRAEVSELQRQSAGLEEQAAEHRARTEQLQTELAQQQEAHRVRVKELDASHSAQLAVLRTAQDAEVSRLRVGYEERLTLLQHKVAELLDAQVDQQQTARYEVAALQKQLAELRVEADEHQARFVAARSQHVKEQDAHLEQAAVLEASHQARLAEAQARHAAEITGLREEQEGQLNQLRQDMENAKAELAAVLEAARSDGQSRMDELVAEVAQLQGAQAAAVTELHAAQIAHNHELTALRSEHDRVISVLRSEQDQVLLQLRLEHEEQVSRLQDVLNAEQVAKAAQQHASTEEIAVLRRQIADLEERASQQHDTLEARMREVQAQHPSQLAEMRSQHAAEISQLRAGYEERLTLLQHKVAELLDAQVDQQKTARYEVAALQTQLVEVRAKHEAEAADLRAGHSEQLLRLTHQIRELQEGKALAQQVAVEESSALQREVAKLTEAGTQLHYRNDQLVAELKGLQSAQAARVAELEASHHAGLAEQQVDHGRVSAKLNQELQLLEAQLQRHEGLLGVLRTEVEQREALAGRLRNDLQQADALAAGLRDELSQRAALCADLRSQLEQRDALTADLNAQLERSGALAAELQAQLAQHEVLAAEARSTSAAHDALVAQLRLELEQSKLLADGLRGQLEQRDALNAGLRLQLEQGDAVVRELRVQTAQQEALAANAQLAHEASVSELRLELAQSTLLVKQLREEGQQRETADLRSELEERDKLVAELRTELEQLKADYELEEHSLHSLSTTKTWMTETIRSLQAELKEAREALAKAEADTQAARRNAGPRPPGTALGWDGAGALATAGDQKATADVAATAVGVTPPTASLIELVADQLAQATMQAAVAEARLEALRAAKGSVEQAAVQPAGCTGVGASQTAAGDQADLMMETVALHGELGEAKAKLRSQQAQLDAVADELAYAVLRASLAEEQLEHLRLQRARSVAAPELSTGVPTAAVTAGKMTADRTDLMMETVVLHGELDEAKGQLRSLQAQQVAVADELAYSVLRASLAEEQLEHLRLLRVSSVSSVAAMGSPSPRAATTNGYLPVAATLAMAPLEPDRPSPERLGTRPVPPLEQVRNLHRELKSITETLRWLVDDAAADACPAAIRQAVSSLWPSISAAVTVAGRVVLSLEELELKSAVDFASRDQLLTGQVAERDVGQALPHSRDRTRAAYRDAWEVYETLRVDAEDLNGRLWRWSSQLREQLVVMEREFTRFQATGGPDWRDLMDGRDAYLRNVEAQVDELQASLQSAHARLMRRDAQVSSLQNLLVQLSEQISVFEGVVVRCEVLSAGLVGKAGIRAA